MKREQLTLAGVVFGDIMYKLQLSTGDQVVLLADKRVFRSGGDNSAMFYHGWWRWDSQLGELRVSMRADMSNATEICWPQTTEAYKRMLEQEIVT